MAPIRFINLLAISSLAVLACSFGAAPVTALVTNIHQVRDISVHAHSTIAKRKRAASGNAKRCRQRPTSSSSASSTPKSSPKASDPKNPSPKAASTMTHTAATHKALATATTSTSGGQGKVGLGWANGPGMPLEPWVTKNVKYLYTWSASLYPDSQKFGVTSMPMLWGPTRLSEFTSLVKKGYSNCVMGFNEPNEPGQSNMSPSEGADMWMKYIEPLYNEGYTMFIAPATSSNPNGMKWMKDWYAICNGRCKPTHHAVHYYDVTAQGFIAYMNLWHDTFNLDIMATEFACENFNGGGQCSQNEVDSFLSESISFMEKTDWVTAYFMFGVMKQMQGVNPLNQLMDSSGKPNPLGQKYIQGSI